MAGMERAGAGAAQGAGTGMVAGSAAGGPGMVIGGVIGGVAGGLSGYLSGLYEEEQAKKKYMLDMLQKEAEMKQQAGQQIMQGSQNAISQMQAGYAKALT